MKRGITALSFVPMDILTSIQIAEEAGYETIELRISMISNFLAQGNSVEDLIAAFGAVSVRPNLVGAIENLDMPEGPQRDELLILFRRMCGIAQELRCPGIQVVSGKTYHQCDWTTIRKETAKGLRELAAVAAGYELTVAYEPLAWMPVKNIELVLDVIEGAGRPDNVGVLVDTFQIFAGKDELQTVAGLDPRLIPTVHLGDAAPRQFDSWSDEDRYTMAGDGIVPLRKIMKAILATGYDGSISDEIWPTRYTYWSKLKLAENLKVRADAVLESVMDLTNCTMG